LETRPSHHQMPVFIIGMILFAAASCLGWMKLQYGFNFTDEGYLATESWRLAVGDHFLDDKITGAFRHYTLINVMIYKIYPDISLLQLRQLQFIITLSALLIFSIALFRQSRQYAWLPFIFSLFAFTGLDPVGLISNMYYQTYPHLFLILYLSFMLFGFQSNSPTIKKSFYLLSGLCLWAMTLSLLYLGLIIVVPVIIFVFSKKFKLKDYPFTFKELLYVLSPFTICWILFIAIFNKSYLLNIFNSLNVILSQSHYSEDLVNFNSEQIKRIILSMAFLSCFFAAIKKLPVHFFSVTCIVLSILITLTINTPLFNFLIPYYDGWFVRPMWFSAMLMGFTILFWIYTIRIFVLKRIFSKKEELSIILMVPFTICACTMYIFSGIGSMAVCQASIPATAAILCFFESTLNKLNLRYRHQVAIFVSILLLGPFYYTTARHDWDFTFYDVPPKHANVRIETGFGRGIYTNKIYSMLYNWLVTNADYFSQPGDYAISYVVSPMVHMITGLRPALDDTFIFFDKSNNYFEKCITKMEQRGRKPKIAFIFERTPIFIRRPRIFPNKQIDFASSNDPISMYIKKHMTPVSRFTISDDHVVRCYVDYNLKNIQDTSQTL